ncbi:glycine-rich protein DC9.1-like [Solanum dulcamara]|uniref:glycine-rich protein DC9.1-like n=1 Tax=Solanum dulcamara TaxID=45834 RepID=UPI00248540B2|nr:glycine-rich protein DC9.1-like [Solanum dulcamara]
MVEIVCSGGGDGINYNGDSRGGDGGVDDYRDGGGGYEGDGYKDGGGGGGDEGDGYRDDGGGDNGYNHHDGRAKLSVTIGMVVDNGSGGDKGGSGDDW